MHDPTTITLDHPAIAAGIAKDDALQAAIRAAAAARAHDVSQPSRAALIRVDRCRERTDALIHGRPIRNIDLGDLFR